MAKNNVKDWDATAANNTDIGGINIAENCLAANINNAIRELMSQVVGDCVLNNNGNQSVAGSLTLGTQATSTSHAVQAARTLTAGDGLSGGGDMSSDRSFAVDSTVIRTTGDQSMSGTKTFTGSIVASSGITVNNGVNATNRNSDGRVESYKHSGSEVGNVSVTAAGTTYNTTSDYRLKENLELMSGAAGRIASIPVYRFNFIGSDETVDGFLAHEVQAVIPEAVSGVKDGDEVQSMDYSRVVPLLTAALQEALERIEALEAK